MSENSLKKAVTENVQAALENVHTCIPASVIAFTGTTVTVKVLVNKLYRDLTSENAPELFNVPARAMQTKLWGISGDLAPGDSGILLFSERDITIVKKLGIAATAPTSRKFDLNDSMFIPFVFSEAVLQTKYRPLHTILYRTDAGFVNMENASLSLAALMQTLCDVLLSLTTFGSAASHTPDPVWLAQVSALQIQLAALMGVQ